MPARAVQAKQQRKWTLASVALTDASTDFILSRQAMNCTRATLDFYKYTAGAFLSWVENQGVTDLQDVTASHVRAYLAQLIALGRKDTTPHANARAIPTLLRFWHAENYMPALIKFRMPRLEKKRLPVLTADQLRQIVKACNTRDKAIILLMTDSGLRRRETIALNCGTFPPLPNQRRRTLCQRCIYTSFQQDKKVDGYSCFPSCVEENLYDPVTTSWHGCLAPSEPWRLGRPFDGGPLRADGRR